MKKLIWAAFAISLLATTSLAQAEPRADVALEFSHFHVIKGFTISMNGVSGSVALNANDWLGVIGDLGVYHGNVGVGLTTATYVMGPRLSYRKLQLFQPFTQVLVGGSHFSVPFCGASCPRGSYFTLAPGAGADIPLGRSGKVALRPQGDFFVLPDVNGSVIGNVRLSFGIAYRLGRK